LPKEKTTQAGGVCIEGDEEKSIWRGVAMSSGDEEESIRKGVAAVEPAASGCPPDTRIQIVRFPSA